MKITNVSGHRLSKPVTAEPGDTVKVYVDYEIVSEIEVMVRGTWDCAITFELNGNLNHVLGDYETFRWLKLQET